MRLPESPSPAPLPPLRPTWAIPAAPDGAAVAGLSSELGLPDALCRLLVLRGQSSLSGAKSFLRPTIDGLHPPELLADSDLAAERLARAVNDGEPILVHGDYDADGISGAALLSGWIRRLGGTAEAFVPHRMRDGYDLSAGGVSRAQELGAGVLVTVDCGIRAHDWIQRAQDLGIDVIVTDHHRPSETLPPAYAVVNPNRTDCPYPNKGLSGTGVAFKLCQRLGRLSGAPEDELWPHLDLVALATVADQVPLTEENRVLVRFGLKALEQTARPGLRQLIRAAGLRQPLDTASIAYGLAPRINAAGRVGETDSALRLLMTEDEDEASELAGQLEQNNRDRKALDGEVLREALDQVAGEFDPGRDRGLVVAGEGWHPGVIGIVASRIVERVFRPVVIVALDGDQGRGSARSIPGFDLYEAVAACSQHLDRFGGHRAAAGMDVQRGSLEAFREAFQDAAATQLESVDLQPVLNADLEIRLDEIPGDFYRFLRYVGPFGQGNPDPVFVTRGVHLNAPPKVTAKGHLKFRMAQGKATFDAIGFGLGDHVSPGDLGTGPIDVAYTLAENTFAGFTTVQARALDVRPAA